MERGGRRPRRARAALAPRRVRRATASSGFPGASPRSACRRRGRSTSTRTGAGARRPGSRGCACSRSASRRRRESSTPSRCSRSSRAPATSSGSTAAGSRWQLLELVLERAAGADRRAEPPRLLADRRSTPTSTAGRASTRPTPPRGSRSSRGLARFPRVLRPLHRHVRVRRASRARTTTCVRSTAALLDAFGPRPPPARLRLPVDPRRSPGYAETIAAVDAHLDGLDEADRARVRGGNAMELFFA